MRYRYYGNNDNFGSGLVIVMLAISLTIIFIKLQPVIFFLLLFLLILIFIYRKNIRYFFSTKQQKNLINENILKKDLEEVAQKEKEKKKRTLLEERKILVQELNDIYRERNEAQREENSLKMEMNKIWEEALVIYRWNYYHSIESEFQQIDNYDGKMFENFVARLYAKLGYTINHQSKGADQGGDLVIKKGNFKIAVQVKRWKNRIGNSAVQQVLGAMHFYGCKEGIVITNSYFTKEAISLAKSANITLIDRDGLGLMCHKFSIEKKIIFDKAKYDRISDLLMHVQAGKEVLEEIVYEVIMKGEILNNLSEACFSAEQYTKTFQHKIEILLYNIKDKDIAISLL